MQVSVLNNIAFLTYIILTYLLSAFTAYYSTRLVVNRWPSELKDPKEFEKAKRLSSQISTGLGIIMLMLSVPIFNWSEGSTLFEIFFVGIGIYVLNRILIQLSMKRIEIKN